VQIVSFDFMVVVKLIININCQFLLIIIEIVLFLQG